MITKQNKLKLLHFAGTAWFIVCIGYVLVLALRQAGFNWWVIFSLSGYSALIIFMLVSLYLFAIFRGVSRSQNVQVEHPLTSTGYYIVLYAVAPFLGGLAGCMGMIGVNSVSQFLLGIALGTLAVTFFVWIVVDPATGLLETLLPASRKHRLERLAQAKALREKKQMARELLLAEVLAKEELDRHRWQEVLKPQAKKLAELLAADRIDFKQAECEAVDIGINAWQTGGLSCMRELREMAIAICKQTGRNSTTIDYTTVWWDGIGSWTNASISKEMKLS